MIVVTLKEFINTFCSRDTKALIQIYPSGVKNIIHYPTGYKAMLADINVWYWFLNQEDCKEQIKQSIKKCKTIIKDRESQDFHKSGGYELLTHKDYTLDTLMEAEVDYIDTKFMGTIAIIIKDIVVEKISR